MIDALLTAVIPAKTAERIKRNCIKWSSTGAYTAHTDGLQIQDFVTAADADLSSKSADGRGAKI